MLLIACAQPVESPAPDKHHTHQKTHNFQSVGAETTQQRRREGERERGRVRERESGREGERERDR